MNFNLKGGTRGSRALCESCKHSFIARGASQNEELIRCGNMYPSTPLPFRVVECSDYAEMGVPSRAELEQRAWLIEVKAGKVMGFVSPTDREKHSKLREADVPPPSIPFDDD